MLLSEEHEEKVQSIMYVCMYLSLCMYVSTSVYGFCMAIGVETLTNTYIHTYIHTYTYFSYFKEILCGFELFPRGEV